MPPIVLPLVFIGMGLLLQIVSMPMILRRVKPNVWYGVRLRTTLSDHTVWYDVNEQAGRELSAAGLVLCLGTGVGVLLGLPSGAQTALSASLLLGGTILASVRSVRLAGKLFSERHPRARGS